MAGIEIDKKAFHDRLSSFINQWKSDKRTDVFAGANSIIIPVGKGDDNSPENDTKTAAFQLWLLSYEFPQTLIVLTPDVVHFITTKKKALYLEPLKGGKVDIEIHHRGKDADENTAQFTKVADLIKSKGKKFGMISGENQTGAFVDEWNSVFGSVKKGLEEVDITAAISAAALSVKDENELRAIRDASRVSSRVLGKYFVDEMSAIVDEEKKVSHDKLSNKIRDLIEKDNGKWFVKNMGKDFDIGSLDWSLGPFIQSGGNYDLKFSTDSDDKNLYSGVIVAALGARYNNYNSFVARTYLVDPSKAQEQQYKLLLSVHNSVLRNIKDGVIASEIYEKALSQVKSKDENLAKNFIKSVGYGVGIQLSDKNLQLNSKCSRALKDGMTFVVTTGFSNLDNPKASDSRGKKYSLVLSDTIRVTGGETVVFTGKDAAADWDNVSFYLEEPQEATPKKSRRDARIGAVAQSNIRTSRLRGERQGNQNAEKELALREHQKELHDRKNNQGREKYAKGTNGTNGTEEKKIKKFESYKRDDDLPNQVKDMGVYLDKKKQTIVLPILGRPVPFHINTIKNASSTREGTDYTSLRINFLSPGQGVGRKDDLPFEEPQAQFVRSLTFRSLNATRMEQIATDVTELKKESVRREQEKKQLEDVVEQDKIVIERRPETLENVMLRPALDTKRVSGTVELHSNGIRYRHGGGGDSTRVDVLFNNIKHFFFQPCKHELMVIIHFHLINPIMIGKKKTRDVQFCRDATDVAFDETGNRKRKHRHGDEDEFEQEQEERKRRADLDKLFLTYSKKIEEAGSDEGLKLDMPLRDMSWHGVPSRSNVIISPTSDCIVQLTEQPFLVVTIDDIEIVHLERVAFGLKNFDMVIIFKDFTRSVQHINTVPMETIDLVKDWLDSVELPFYEGALNLQWGAIMKTIVADPHAFFHDKGWNFLSTDSDSEDEGEESEEESAFEDESDFGSDESTEDESDFDENASQEAEDEEMSEVSEGEDWDELERKAARKDRERGEEEDDGGKGRKRKR